MPIEHNMDIVALKAVLRQAKKRGVTEVVRETYAMENDESRRLFSLGEQLAILMNRLASQDEERRARMFM